MLIVNLKRPKKQLHNDISPAHTLLLVRKYSVKANTAMHFEVTPAVIKVASVEQRFMFRKSKIFNIKISEKGVKFRMLLHRPHAISGHNATASCHVFIFENGFSQFGS